MQLVGRVGFEPTTKRLKVTGQPSNFQRLTRLSVPHRRAKRALQSLAAQGVGKFCGTVLVRLNTPPHRLQPRPDPRFAGVLRPGLGRLRLGRVQRFPDSGGGSSCDLSQAPSLLLLLAGRGQAGQWRRHNRSAPNPLSPSHPPAVRSTGTPHHARSAGTKHTKPLACGQAVLADASHRKEIPWRQRLSRVELPCTASV